MYEMWLEEILFQPDMWNHFFWWQFESWGKFLTKEKNGNVEDSDAHTHDRLTFMKHYIFHYLSYIWEEVGYQSLLLFFVPLPPLLLSDTKEKILESHFDQKHKQWFRRKSNLLWKNVMDKIFSCLRKKNIGCDQ